MFVYAGRSGALATSTNAITWTARTSGTIGDIFSLTYGNGLYVYAGDNGVLRTSTDGISWTARTSGTSSKINALTYGDGLYVYGGQGGVLRTSAVYTYNFSTEFLLPDSEKLIEDFNILDSNITANQSVYIKAI